MQNLINKIDKGNSLFIHPYACIYTYVCMYVFKARGIHLYIHFRNDYNFNDVETRCTNIPVKDGPIWNSNLMKNS